MGVETTSEHFLGAYEMYADLEVLKKLTNELGKDSEASFWVYTHDQLLKYNDGATEIFNNPVYFTDKVGINMNK